MKKYQKPSFEEIKYSVEEVLTVSGGLIYDPNNPSPPDDNQDWGDLH